MSLGGVAVKVGDAAVGVGDAAFACSFVVCVSYKMLEECHCTMIISTGM